MKFTHEERDSCDYYSVTSDNGIKITFYASAVTADIDGDCFYAESVNVRSRAANGIYFVFEGVPLSLNTIALKLESWLEELEEEQREEGENEYDAPIVL